MRPQRLVYVVLGAILVAVLGVGLLRYRLFPSLLLGDAASRISLERGGIDVQARWLLSHLHGSVSDRASWLIASYPTEGDEQRRGLIARAIGLLESEADQAESKLIGDRLMEFYREERSQNVRGQILSSFLDMKPRQEVTTLAERVCLDETESDYVRVNALLLVRRSLEGAKLETLLRGLERSPSEFVSKSASGILAQLKASATAPSEEHQRRSGQPTGH